jgi:hypothetical protein
MEDQESPPSYNSYYMQIQKQNQNTFHQKHYHAKHKQTPLLKQ